MCGIGGIYTTSGAPMLVDEVKALWEALEDRGTHASGISFCWEDSDKPIVHKAAKTASDISKIVDKTSGDNTLYAFFHTRYSTGGSTANNGNNHPVVSHDIILTHNGVLRNDDDIFMYTRMNREYEVDTEAINAALRFGGVEYTAEIVAGSMSIAWVDITQNHEIVNLMTNGGNPLVIARVNGGQVVWASSLEHIEYAGFTVESSFNAEPYKHYTIYRDAAGGVLINSVRVSDELVSAQVSGMYKHTSSYATDVGYGRYSYPTLGNRFYSTASKKSTKTGKKAKNAAKRAKKASKRASKKKQTRVVSHGMEFDPETQSWRKLRG